MTNNKKKIMNKEKLYDTNIGTFKMMFGFAQPGYPPKKWLSIKTLTKTKNK